MASTHHKTLALKIDYKNRPFTTHTKTPTKYFRMYIAALQHITITVAVLFNNRSQK